MTSKPRLFGAAVLIAAAWLLAPALSAGFRSEDFLDFEYYSRAGLREVVTGTHLGMELLHYWRPLADVATWGLVHVLGPRPWAVHFVLVLLQAATAAAAGWVVRRTFGLSVGAAWAAALLVLVHPLAPAVLTYVDGGVPALLAALFTLLALGELGEWRDGNSHAGRVFLCATAAALSYDPALLVAPLLCVIAWLLPRSERRVPWFLLLVPLLVAAARGLLGVGYLGYPVQPDRQMVVEFVPRVATAVGRQFAAVFADDVHSRGLAALAYATLAAVALGAVVVAVRTRHGRIGVAVRQAAALALLVVGLIAFAPELFLLGGRPDQPPARPEELIYAYKTWPAAAAAALFTAWLFGRASGRRWWGALALALPWAAVEIALRAPIAAVHTEAVAWAQRTCDGVAARAAERGARRVLVLEVPVANGPAAGIAKTRVLQYGLGAALRPPLRPPSRDGPLDAYPVFRVRDNRDVLASPATFDALAASPWLLPLRCGATVDAPVEVVARPEPPSGAGALRLFADGSGVERILASDLADAPVVTVDAADSIELFVSGDAPGELRLFVLNRITPVFVAPAPPRPANSTLPPPGMDLERTHRDPGPDRLVAHLAKPAWFREITTRYPDDVVFLVLEARPDAARSPGTGLAVTTSNVLPVRLTRGAGARH